MRGRGVELDGADGGRVAERRARFAGRGGPGGAMVVEGARGGARGGKERDVVVGGVGGGMVGQVMEVVEHGFLGAAGVAAGVVEVFVGEEAGLLMGGPEVVDERNPVHRSVVSFCWNVAITRMLD